MTDRYELSGDGRLVCDGAGGSKWAVNGRADHEVDIDVEVRHLIASPVASLSNRERG
jgi:hypothetical protein